MTGVKVELLAAEAGLKKRDDSLWSGHMAKAARGPVWRGYLRGISHCRGRGIGGNRVDGMER